MNLTSTVLSCIMCLCKRYQIPFTLLPFFAIFLPLAISNFHVFPFFFRHFFLLENQERKRVVSRGSSSKAEPRARAYAVEAMEASARSGWLSREQLAANEFAKRVGFERGVGLPAAAIAQWKRNGGNGQQGQQPQQQQQQQSGKVMERLRDLAT